MEWSDLNTKCVKNASRNWKPEEVFLVEAKSQSVTRSKWQRVFWILWAMANNLLLNTKKSQEMVFRRPRERASGRVVVPELPDVARVSSMKILGVVISSNFSMEQHVQTIITSSGQALYALRVLKSHGMSEGSLQSVFQSTVVSRLTYASMAGVRKRSGTGSCWSIPEKKHEGRVLSIKLAHVYGIMRGMRRQSLQIHLGQQQSSTTSSSPTENAEIAQHENKDPSISAAKQGGQSTSK